VEVARVRGWFLPETPDVLGLLEEQAGVTVGGFEALVDWAAGDPTGMDRVREAEHRADERKRELRRALTEAYVTPLDAEDVYTLSERLDTVMNGAKDAVREAELMAMSPDEHVLAMCSLLAEGVRTDAADAAIRSQRNLERVYRTAMSNLLKVEDLREVMGRRELYRRLSRMSEDIIEVAERVWYAILKEG
jgi:uncharacterized protein Yka (UPF0111/DUF47 family)